MRDTRARATGATRRAPSPVPIGESCASPTNTSAPAGSTTPKRLLDHILAAAPTQGDALHLAGIVAFRQGDIATVARC